MHKKNVRTLGEELISIIKARTPEKEKTVNFLMDILPLEKEAIYRRLRGEVPFTLEETATICRELNISLDLLMGLRQESIYAFHHNMTSEDPLQNYYESLLNINRSMDYIADESTVWMYRAHRALPQEFLYNFKFLSRVYTYILYYQLSSRNTTLRSIKSFAEFHVSEELMCAQQQSTINIQGFNSSLILDKRIFIDYIEIVKYFHVLGLIAKDDIDKIKEELMLMIDDMERCATTGLSLKGKKMDMYLSHISFDCSYSYLESSNFSVSSLGIYCVNYLACQNVKINEMQKHWIKSLMKFSSIISISDELKRKEFFMTQRNYIETLL